MKRKVGSFYKKSLISRGLEKANQVVKRQKAQAEVAKALQKQAANKTGRYLKKFPPVNLILIQLLLFSDFQLKLKFRKKEDIFLLCILNVLSTLLSGKDYLIKIF